MKKSTPLILSLLLYGSSLFGQNFWQQTNGPLGGWVYCYSINAQGDIFAGTLGNGIFRSTNNGESWEASTIPSAIIRSLTINKPQHIFAGGDRGMYRSTDNGASWIFLNNTATWEISYLTVDTAGNLFAAFVEDTLTFVSRSSDEGTSWTALLIFEQPAVYAIRGIAFNTSQHIFVATNVGIFRSVNEGANWNHIFSGDCLSLYITRDDSLFTYSYPQGLSRSGDNGNTWDVKKTGLSVLDNGSYMVAMIEDQNSSLFAGTQEYGVYRSTNKGDNWNKTWSTSLNPFVSALALTAQNDIFVGTYDGVILSTDNGNSWENKNTGLIATNVNASAANPQGDIIAASNIGNIFRTTNQGDTWEKIRSCLGNFTVYSIAINAQGHIFVASMGEGVLRSTDNGASWSILKNGIADKYVSSIFVNDDQTLLIGKWSDTTSIYRSEDNGEHWQPVKTGLPNESISVVSFSGNDRGFVFAGARYGGVYRSSDRGLTWTHTALTTPYILEITTNKKGQVFASAAEGVFRSTDDGDTWQLFSIGSSDNLILSLTVNDSNHVFAGTACCGVYRSTDDGETWAALENGLDRPGVYSLVIDPKGVLYAGTTGGMYKSVRSTLSVESAGDIFTNLSIHPHPITDRTTITFKLPRTEHIILKVFDMLGNEIAALATEVYSSGEHSIEWDTGDLPTGFYYCTIQTPSILDRKLLLKIR
jgi:photosystem II stability/assembly factor-like uncharacterized protein